MPSIKASFVRDLKLRVNIADVVSRVVTLKRAGSQFKGLSPFNQEKTPSFYVTPDKGFYKCFSSGKAGDIISFVRETEGLTFSEAVETLAQRFGMVVEYEEGSGPSREERSIRQEIFQIHEIAAEHYHHVFKASQPAGDWMRAYWTEQRRFTLELAEEFKIGAAAPADQGLAGELLKRKFSEEALRQCGLFFVRDNALPTLGTMRPRFRGRLMIPIRDHQGRVVAFTARQTELTPEDDPAREAKYVNSPETPIFVKSQLLFNLDRARAHATDGHPFVLVEGQLDALRCWSAGLKTAIAPQGTSITEGQLHLLRRYHPQVECFFDGDAPGQKAALRFLPMALKAGLEVRFLGGAAEGKVDPDLLFLEKGLDAYAELHAASLTAMGFACRSLLADPYPATAEEKARAARAVYDIVLQSESEVIRSQFLAEAAGHLRLPPDAMTKDFLTQSERQARRDDARAAYAAADRGITAVHAPSSSRSVSANTSLEDELLHQFLTHRELFTTHSARFAPEAIDSSSLAGALLNRLIGEFESGHWNPADPIDPHLATEAEQAHVASLAFMPNTAEDPAKVVDAMAIALELRSLNRRKRQLELALAEQANVSNDEHFRLMIEANQLNKQINRLRLLSTPTA